jgi:hypothetical protein
VTPLYPQKLALTSPTGGGRSVGIVRSRTKATEFSLVYDPNGEARAEQFTLMICGTAHWNIQGDSFGTRPKEMRISQRLFIRF